MAYYSFIITRDVIGTPERIAVLYHHRNGREAAALGEALEDLTNRRLSPTRVLVVCGLGRQKEIKREFAALDQSTKSRLGVTSHILVLPYGFHGRAEESAAIAIRGTDWAVSDAELHGIAVEGLKQLIDETGVILRAPRGYVFRKPSGSTSRTFIRTGNMFREPSALAITSHLLMREIPADIDTLFIDSFTIPSPAMAFVGERAAIAKQSKVKYSEPAISNFHSYSIDPGLRFPGYSNYSVLISASTSGKLARKLVDEHGAKPELLHHMVILSSDQGLQSRSMYFEEKEPESKRAAQAFRREISIPGEEFIASSGEPHPARITKSHFSPLESKTLSLPFYQGALTVNLSAPGHSAYSLITLDEIREGENGVFDKWLEDEVEHSIPANVGWILPVDAKSSRELATRVAAMLKSHLGRELPVLTLSDLVTNGVPPRDSGDRTVLVVAAETGLGEELLSASRALRNVKHKHRHYLVGHVFPESASQFERLQNNLRVSGRSRRYGWSCFLASPLGQIEGHDSWRIESECLERGLSVVESQSFPAKLLKSLIARNKALKAQGVRGECLFLPRPDLKPLLLRPESVLFSRSYKDVSQVTVYLMVSAALQRARDHVAPDGSALDEDMCFHGSPFIVSLLDPDMFSRFNDGVIQAAFMRACAPDELNYADHQILSRNVRDILIAAVRHSGSDAGEAVMEMLFALATKRLRLKDEHFEDVLVAVRKNKLLHSFWRLLKAEDAF